MIIQRYLLRETAYTFFGVGLLLVLIYLSGTLIRILANAAEGDYPVAIVMQLFLLKGVGNLVFILPLAFFLGVLLALGRLYKDSEMAAMTACGIGPGRVLTSVGTLSVMVAILLGTLALYFAPWSEERAQQLLDAAQAKTDLKGIEAGRFNSAENGSTLFYAEQVERDKDRLENVFGYGKPEGGPAELISARDAYQTLVNGSRYMVFVDGYRYEGLPNQPDFKIVQFQEHGVLVRERDVVATDRPRHAVPSMTLLRSDVPGDTAELQWRIAVPISTVLLALAAVPLARTSPRQGRYGKMFLGILIYVAYNNLLTVARSSLAKGEYSPWLGLWWVHALMLALTGYLVWRQYRMPGPRRNRRLER